MWIEPTDVDFCAKAVLWKLKSTKIKAREGNKNIFVFFEKLVKCPLKYRVAMTLLYHQHTSFVKSEPLKRFSTLVKEPTNNPKVGI